MSRNELNNTVSSSQTYLASLAQASADCVASLSGRLMRYDHLAGFSFVQWAQLIRSLAVLHQLEALAMLSWLLEGEFIVVLPMIKNPTPGVEGVDLFWAAGEDWESEIWRGCIRSTSGYSAQAAQCYFGTSLVCDSDLRGNDPHE
jgi:hypothetical protein